MRLLVVLTLASSASADCAWVLWKFFRADNSFEMP
jgi:hypothetical protein